RLARGDQEARHSKAYRSQCARANAEAGRRSTGPRARAEPRPRRGAGASHAGAGRVTATGEPLEIEVGERVGRVSGLLLRPPEPWAGYVLAHGAGAGMTHPFMESVARGLMARGIATLRYQFPYTEAGARRPDPPRVLIATVRAAVARAEELLPELQLF